MLLNNVESDLKTRLEEEGITQKELGYDVELIYKKKASG